MCASYSKVWINKLYWVKYSWEDFQDSIIKSEFVILNTHRGNLDLNLLLLCQSLYTIRLLEMKWIDSAELQKRNTQESH